MSFDPPIEKRIHEWLEGSYDSKTKEEIRRLLKEDPKKLSDSFFKEMSFGTGGMRGLMGVGTNRMNIYTIRNATQGLATHLKKEGQSHPVFIGYDVRHHSREFAEETARVLAGNQISVLIAQEICPTPLVSFACRYFRCSAAIMITASHNPPEYNGYKVYWSDGAQVVPPHDVKILEEVKKVKEALLGPIDSPLIKWVGGELDQAYLKELALLQIHPELSHIELKILYSNLHGTGIRLVPAGLKKWGYRSLSFVEKQKSLDGDFPFAHSPNPEEEEALQLGTEELIHAQADLFIATDPDADRMGIVTQKGGKPYRFSGNQIACLCLHHLCVSLTQKGTFPQRAAFVKTIVTTELFKAIAESFGGLCMDVLTGFKYIAEQIRKWEEGSFQYVFGAEESYGYLYGTFVRDKDAISSSCLITEAAAMAKKEGLTLLDRLHQIYRKYGIHRESLTHLSFSDTQAGLDQIQRVMHRLRLHPPPSVNGKKVVKIEDYLKPTPLPLSDVLRFWLEDGSKIIIRTSGTEPKVKIYAEVMEKVVGEIEEGILRCDEKLKKIKESFFPVLGI